MLSVCQKQAPKGMGFHKERIQETPWVQFLFRAPLILLPRPSKVPSWGHPVFSFKDIQLLRLQAMKQGFSKHEVVLGTLWRSKHWQVMSQLPVTLQQRGSLGKCPAHTALLLSPADLDVSISLLAFCLKFLFDLELPNYQIKWNEHDKKVHWNLPQSFEETSNKTRKRASGHLPSDIKQKAAH